MVIKLVKSLTQKFETIVISDIHLDNTYPCETIFYKHNYSMFQKFALLFNRPINSVQERKFVKRNVYRRSKNLINILFILKLLVSKIFYLPLYSDIVFFLFKRKRVEKGIINKGDLCIVDSNLRHTLTINPLVVRASIVGKLISFVYSWDNPQYSTLNKFSLAYLVINKQNKKELIDFYNISEEKFFITGSLIHDYLMENGLPRDTIDQEISESKELKILYAAVFGNIDEIMIKEEVNFILNLLKHLENNGVNNKLIFRPYPSIANPDLYKPIENHPNIYIYKHDNFKTIPRLGNESETISFSKSEEKINQFFDVDVLLSAGSTYTLEFAYSNKPIVHMNANKFIKSKENLPFFERLSIYGHLNHFSNGEFKDNIVGNFTELVRAIKK